MRRNVRPSGGCPARHCVASQHHNLLLCSFRPTPLCLPSFARCCSDRWWLELVCRRWRRVVHSSPRFWGELTLPLGAESEQPATAQLPAGLLRTRALHVELLPGEQLGLCQLGTVVTRLTHLQQLSIQADESYPLVAPADLWEALLCLPELHAWEAVVVHSVPPQAIAALTRLTRLRLDADHTPPGLCAAVAGLTALQDLHLRAAALGDCGSHEGAQLLPTLTQLTSLTHLRVEAASIPCHRLPRSATCGALALGRGVSCLGRRLSWRWANNSPPAGLAQTFLSSQFPGCLPSASGLALTAAQVWMPCV